MDALIACDYFGSVLSDFEEDLEERRSSIM